MRDMRRGFVNDDDLVYRTLQGDMDAFAEIVERYQGDVYNLSYRMLGDAHEAEDAAQEAFLRCYAQCRTFEPGRKFSTWLLSVTSHLCIDLLRRRRFRWLPWDDATCDHPAAPEEEPETVAVRREKQQELQQLLQAMPPKYRLVTVLRYWHDLSHQEIAEATGLTESAVKTRLFRAREWLAKELHPVEDGGTTPKPLENTIVDATGQSTNNTYADCEVERRCGVVMLSA